MVIIPNDKIRPKWPHWKFWVVPIFLTISRLNESQRKLLEKNYGIRPLGRMVYCSVFNTIHLNDLKNQDLKPTGRHWTTPCFSLNCCCCWSRPWHVLQVLWYIEHGKHGGHGGKHGAQGKVQDRSGSTGGTMKKAGNKNHRLLLAVSAKHFLTNTTGF